MGPRATRPLARRAGNAGRPDVAPRTGVRAKPERRRRTASRVSVRPENPPPSAAASRAFSHSVTVRNHGGSGRTMASPMPASSRRVPNARGAIKEPAAKGCPWCPRRPWRRSSPWRPANSRPPTEMPPTYGCLLESSPKPRLPGRRSEARKGATLRVWGAEPPPPLDPVDRQARTSRLRESGLRHFARPRRRAPEILADGEDLGRPAVMLQGQAGA